MADLPISSGVAKRLSYKAYTDALITPGVTPVPATDPAATGGQVLRRVSSVINLNKDSFESTEINTYRQVVDVRHGARSVAGTINGELSCATFQDLMAAVLRGTWTAGLSKTQADFTSLTGSNSASKFTLGSSDGATLGFRVGDVLRPTVSAYADSGKNFTITGFSGADIDVYPAPTDLTSTLTATLAIPGRKLSMPDVPTIPKIAFEHYYEDVDITHLFTECRIGTMKVTGDEKVSTVEFTLMGRDKVEYTGASSPFFTAPTAPTSTAVLTTYGGSLLLNGVAIAAITKFDFEVNLSPSSQKLAFDTYLGEIYTNKAKITGSIDVMFYDNTTADHFSAEDVISLAFMLTDADTATANFINFFFSQVKLTAANFADGGEQGVPVTYNFQAYRKATATGYDATSMTVIDSLSA